MKDLVQIWNRVTNQRYSNCADRELNDLPNNRYKSGDLDKSALEANFSECEILNNKFCDDVDFNVNKDAIINRLFERRRKGQLTRQPKCLFLLLLLGFFSLGVGCFIFFVHPYDFLFRQKSLLQDGGEIFEMWRKPEVDLYTRIFLFNITNAEEYMAGKDDKIKLKEVGPYVYRELIEHNVTSFNKNSTLSAIPVHPLQWVEELSEGHKEDDILYLPHIALLSIANVVSQQSFVTKFGLNNLITFTNSQPLAKMTARQFMMGYESKLMTLGNTFLPGWIYFDKLGLIDRMYDFNGDYETIFTGEDDVHISGLIDTYKGSTDLPQWKEKHCSNVQYASDGTKFKGGVTKNETVLFFRKSMCRAAPMIPVEEGDVHGLRGYRYTFPDNMLDNGKYLKENKCFCRNGKCLPDGLIDVTDCYYGFPIALSYPHFYQGEDILFSKVEGLKPNKEDHETSMWVQPDSGLPLDVSSKFQINMALGDISSIKNTERFSNMYLPLLWFDIRMYRLTPNLEQRFKLYLNILPVVEQVAMYFLFATGAGLILTSIYILTFKVMFKTFEKNQRSYINSDNCFKERLNNDGIYTPCEIPLSDSENEQPDPENPKQLMSDKLRDFSVRLNDKFLSTISSVYTFDGKGSMGSRGSKTEVIEGYSDQLEETDSQTDDDDFKYLEVIDDEIQFVNNDRSPENGRSKMLKELDSVDKNNEFIVHLTR